MSWKTYTDTSSSSVDCWEAKVDFNPIMLFISCCSTVMCSIWKLKHVKILLHATLFSHKSGKSWGKSTKRVNQIWSLNFDSIKSSPSRRSFSLHIISIIVIETLMVMTKYFMNLNITDAPAENFIWQRHASETAKWITDHSIAKRIFFRSLTAPSFLWRSILQKIESGGTEEPRIAWRTDKRGFQHKATFSNSNPSTKIAYIEKADKSQALPLLFNYTIPYHTEWQVLGQKDSISKRYTDLYASDVKLSSKHRTRKINYWYTVVQC